MYMHQQIRVEATLKKTTSTASYVRPVKYARNTKNYRYGGFQCEDGTGLPKM